MEKRSKKKGTGMFWDIFVVYSRDMEKNADEVPSFIPVTLGEEPVIATVTGLFVSSKGASF